MNIFTINNKTIQLVPFGPGYLGNFKLYIEGVFSGIFSENDGVLFAYEEVTK